MGDNRAARRAGNVPKLSPTATADNTAVASVLGVTAADSRAPDASARTIAASAKALAKPIVVPTPPPR